MYSKSEIGKKGEDIAEKYLKINGYEIINRNYRCKSGEIDIIAKEKGEIVFIEVKTRTDLKCGYPAEAVDNTKKKHLYKVAEYFLYRNNLLDIFCRFDVIEIYLTGKKCNIIHLRNVEIYSKEC